MKFQGAVVTEKDTTFAIATVQMHVMGDKEKMRRIMELVKPVFPAEVPVILMSINPRGIPLFFGQQEIVNYLTQMSVESIPWKWFEVEETEGDEEESPPAKETPE